MVKRRRRSRRLNFKSMSDYRRWLAYNYIHNREQMLKPPHCEIYIRGKKHRVRHKRRR